MEIRAVIKSGIRSLDRIGNSSLPAPETFLCLKQKGEAYAHYATSSCRSN